MKKIIFFLSIVMFLASCAEKTKITGHISNADNAMLYFECNKMSNIEVLDSVKLNKKGKFSFSVTRNKFPEFYQVLRKMTIAVPSNARCTLNYSALPLPSSSSSACLSLAGVPTSSQSPLIFSARTCPSRAHFLRYGASFILPSGTSLKSSGE